MGEVKRCTRCIMDNSSDITITFDEKGYCNYCTTALSQISTSYFPNGEGSRRLEKLLADIKSIGRGKKYDCIMGLSGGLDSSYLAYLGYKCSLRVMAVHIDDGYNTEISKANLKKLIEATGFDYETVIPDAQQYNALNLAYMRAGVPCLDIPQDNVLFAFLYKKAKEYGIKYFLSGNNFSLECILQRGNIYTAYDVTNIKDINKRFGTLPLNKLVLISTLQYRLNRLLYGLKTECPLNYIDYNRDRAFKELKDFCGFQYYGRKHLENILTAFIQLYWFPKKFGVDKRTSHLSSMIVSGQMTREEALKEYAQPLYDEAQMAEYISIIKKNIGISDAEFEKIMNAPTHQHNEFAVQTDTFCYKFFRMLHRILKV